MASAAYQGKLFRWILDIQRVNTPAGISWFGYPRNPRTGRPCAIRRISQATGCALRRAARPPASAAPADVVQAAARADGVDLLVQVGAAAQQAQAAHERDVRGAEPARRERTHALGREDRQQRAVLEFAHHARHDAAGIEPALQPVAQRRVRGRQQQGQRGEHGRKGGGLHSVHQRGRAVPVHRRLHQTLAAQAQRGRRRWRLAGEDQVRLVHGQLAQELPDLALVAHEAQRRRLEHGLQQRMRGQLGQTVRQPHDQAHDRRAGGWPHLLRDELA